MPRQNDKDNGRRRGPPARPPRSGGATGGGKGKDKGGKGRVRPAAATPRAVSSRPRAGDEEPRKGRAPAFGKRPRTAGRSADSARSAAVRPDARRDEQRAGRVTRKPYAGADRKQRSAEEPRRPKPFRDASAKDTGRPPRRPFRDAAAKDAARPPRGTFRDDAAKDAGRPPRGTFRDGRRKSTESEASPRKDTAPRGFEKPRGRAEPTRAARPALPHQRESRPSRDAENSRASWQEHPRGQRAGRPAGERGQRRSEAGGDGRFRQPAARDTRPKRKPVQAPPPARPDKTGERIAKLMARAGLASRREAEAWITEGRVAVNGRIITSPALDVMPNDVVTVDGAPLPERERTRLFLYHKPRGLMTTHADPEGRPTVFEHLPEGLPRLVSVGRLDFNTEGLLLLTNDGGLARALELPQTGWLRRYRVRAHGAVTQPQLDALRGGVTLGGVRYGAIEATLERVQGANVWLTFAIREGKNREVRNVLAHLGLEVNRLIRISYGPFQLGELAEGTVEEVKTRVLREQIGAALLQRAGAWFPPSAAAPADGAEPAGTQDAPRVRIRVKRAVVADRKGRKVVVERADGGDETPAAAPYRRPRRRYHGKRDIAREEP